MFGEGALTDQTCQKWFAKFHAGDFSLDHAPSPSRLVEIDSDQIETLIESNQYYIMQEIADILKISKSIKLLLKMKKMCLSLPEKTIDFLANLIVLYLLFIYFCSLFSILLTRYTTI